MLNVNGWQGLFDFQSGQPVEDSGQPYLELPKKICREHPYPGDTNPKSVAWVTDTALSVCEQYDPQLLVVSYASANILRINTAMSDEQQLALSHLVMDEAKRLLDSTDYTPILISNGGLKHFERVLDLSHIEGVPTFAADKYLGGIFYPTAADYEAVRQLPGVRWESRESFIRRYGITEPYALERTPEIILHADADTALTNVGERGTVYYMIPECKDTCLCWTTLPGMPDSIFALRAFMDQKLAQGKKLALIITEAIDDALMPAGSHALIKCKDGISYGDGVSFYYALLNGREFNAPGMPYIFHNRFLKNKSKKRYPFSYIKSENYQDPIGLNRAFRTAAVGNRSGLLHSAAMCDYCIECHSRGLAESGLLAFINEGRLNC